MTQRDLVIIDSGGANIASVLFAFERLGQKAILTADPDKILAATYQGSSLPSARPPMP